MYKIIHNYTKGIYKIINFKVKHIFVDKTGTLTTSAMKLKHCSIAGELYLDGSQNKLKMVSHVKMLS